MGFWGKATPTLTPTSATPNPHLPPTSGAILVGGDPALIDLDARVELPTVEDPLSEAEAPPLYGHRGGGHGLVAVVRTPSAVPLVEVLGLLSAALVVGGNASLLHKHARHVVGLPERLGCLPDALRNLEATALPEPVQSLQRPVEDARPLHLYRLLDLLVLLLLFALGENDDLHAPEE